MSQSQMSGLWHHRIGSLVRTRPTAPVRWCLSRPTALPSARSTKAFGALSGQERRGGLGMGVRTPRKNLQTWSVRTTKLETLQSGESKKRSCAKTLENT